LTVLFVCLFVGSLVILCSQDEPKIVWVMTGHREQQVFWVVKGYHEQQVFWVVTGHREQQVVWVVTGHHKKQVFVTLLPQAHDLYLGYPSEGPDEY